MKPGQTDHADNVIASLAPSLKRLKGEHADRRQSLIRWIAVSLLLGAVAGLVLVLVFGWAWRSLFVLAMIGALAVAGFQMQRVQKSWSEQVIGELIPAICAAWGEVRYAPAAPSQDFLSPFLTLHAVGHHNQRDLGHYFSGRIGQRQFEMLHASLTQRSGGKSSSSTPVFYGLLIRFQLTLPSPAPILVLPRAALGGKVKGMVMVEPELPEFAAKFTVQVPGDMPAAPGQARSFLDPSWQRSLLAINETEGRAHGGLAAVRLGMIQDSGYLALSRWIAGGSLGKLRFERPRPFLDVPFVLRQKINLEDSARAMLDDVGVVFRIISQLPADA